MWWQTLWNEGRFELQWGVVLAASTVAALWDVKSRRIPNVLTGPLWVGGLVYASIAGGWLGLIDGALASIALALPYVLLFLFAGGGAGDAKLMGGLGAWLGLVQGAYVLAAVAIAGIFLAFAVAIHQRRTWELIGRLKAMVAVFLVFIGYRLRVTDLPQMMPVKSEMIPMPYALAVCVGVWCAAWGSYLWRG